MLEKKAHQNCAGKGRPVLLLTEQNNSGLHGEKDPPTGLRLSRLLT